MVRASHNWPTLENLEPRVLLSAFPLFSAATFRNPAPFDDYGNTIAAAYSVSLNSAGAAALSGVINTPGDIDMFKVVASRTGTITVDQRAGTASPLDSYLHIYAPNGACLGANDDAYGTLNSHVCFSVVAGQTYYYYVETENGTAVSAPSNEVIATIPLAAPTSLAVGSIA